MVRTPAGVPSGFWPLGQCGCISLCVTHLCDCKVSFKSSISCHTRFSGLNYGTTRAFLVGAPYLGACFARDILGLALTFTVQPTRYTRRLMVVDFVSFLNLCVSFLKDLHRVSYLPQQFSLSNYESSNMLKWLVSFNKFYLGCVSSVLYQAKYLLHFC